jgi:hypothetical protein
VWVWRPFEKDVLVCREIVRDPREFIPWTMKTIHRRAIGPLAHHNGTSAYECIFSNKYIKYDGTKTCAMEVQLHTLLTLTLRSAMMSFLNGRGLKPLSLYISHSYHVCYMPRTSPLIYRCNDRLYVEE